AFECSAFRTVQSQYDNALLGNLLQRFEPSRALVVVIQQETVEASVTENLRNRAVVPRRIELALIIAAAQVQTENDSRVVPDDGVVHFDREIEKTVRVIAALPVSLTELRIKQCRVLRRINLDVRAAKTNQFLHFV